MRKTMVRTTGGGLLALVCAGGAAAQELAYRFPGDGAALRYRLKTMRKATTGAGPKAPATTESGEWLLELAGGAAAGEVRVRFREVALKTTGAKLDLAYDAKAPPDELAVATDLRLGVLGGLLGDGFALAVSRKDGAAAKEVDELPARAAARGTNVTPGKAVIAMADVRTWLESHLWKAGLPEVFLTLPPTPDPKAQWPRKVTGEIEGLDAVTDLRYRLITAPDGKGTVTITGSVTLTEDEKPLPTKGTIAGTAVFDTKAGRLLSSKLTTTLKLPANATLTTTAELEFVAEVDAAGAGPASFEKPLPTGATCLERRLAKPISRGQPVPIQWEDNPDDAACQVAPGDVLRVIERRQQPEGIRLHVVTAAGKDGWLWETSTEPCK